MNKKYIKLQIQPLSGMSAKFKSTLNWELNEKGGKKAKDKTKTNRKKPNITIRQTNKEIYIIVSMRKY